MPSSARIQELSVALTAGSTASCSPFIVYCLLCSMQDGSQLSGGHRRIAKCPRPAPGNVHRLVSMVLQLACIGLLGCPYPAGAAVYECLDRAGKTVLSNKQSGLHHCRVLSEDHAPASPPPNAGMTPPGSSPPMNSEIPSAPPSVPPMPPDQPAGMQESSNVTAPAPSSSQLRPCSYGMNPLNPLSNLPCVQSDQSGAVPVFPQE